MSNDPFEHALEYLKQVPTGKATVTAKQAKEDSRFKNRAMPLHLAVQEWAEHQGFTCSTEWAEHQGFTFSTDRAEPAVATQFYFRVKP